MLDKSDTTSVSIPRFKRHSSLFIQSPHMNVIRVVDEEKGWAITERELELRRTAAVERDGLEIRAFTMINPGNPTGQVLSREELEIICKFCSKYDIVLLADEVYQVC